MIGVATRFRGAKHWAAIPMAKDVIKVSIENDLAEKYLTALLRIWRTPEVPVALDRRVTATIFWIDNYQLGFASPRSTPTHPEVPMKRCNACQEEFADKFSFCPVDGSPLNSLAAALVGRKVPGDSHAHNFVLAQSTYFQASTNQPEFKLTMISTVGLWFRLREELSFNVAQLRRAWPDFKRHPIKVGKRAAGASIASLNALLRQPNAVAGTVTAVLLVLSAILALVLMGRTPKIPVADQDREEVVEMLAFNLPSEPPKPEGTGVGVGSNGRVGLSIGKGEGSEAEPKPAHGGGSGGDHNQQAAQQGKVPPPSDVPARISPPLPNPSLAAGVDLDPALWKNLPFVAYGDSRSKSTAVSNGPGDGGGIGTNKGLGVGDGNGNGVGKGDNGNMGDGSKDGGGRGPGGSKGNDPRGAHTVFKIFEVTQRAKVISKPEPQYTEAARKNQVTGSVILSVIFSESGEVTSIRAIRVLPDGLTEKAIAAARQIRFVPAVRNGQPVSVYMQLEYNFNLY
ncbi:MAG: TonB family C-terminal domain protein [Acidobacteria bacterium]|nr:TonB family C-terminal domain protein [Acidobacteriota bacterium]